MANAVSNALMDALRGIDRHLDHKPNKHITMLTVIPKG